MSSPCVLLVEDDPAIGDPLARSLRREGYDVRTESDGESGLQAGLDAAVSLVVLDIGLPGLDGLEVCRRLRRARPQLQILLLTALTEEVDTVVGLDAGADDYVAKPFRLAELLARVRAAVRRAAPQVVVAGPVTVDTPARRVWVGGEEVALSPKEFDLLSRLASEAGRVVGRDQLLADVWGSTWPSSGRSLDQHVSWLRAKLGDGVITTVRGRGYRLEVDGGAR